MMATVDEETRDAPCHKCGSVTSCKRYHDVRSEWGDDGQLKMTSFLGDLCPSCASELGYELAATAPRAVQTAPPAAQEDRISRGAAKIEKVMPHVIGWGNAALLAGLLCIWTPGSGNAILWLPLLLFGWNIFGYIRWLDKRGYFRFMDRD